MADSVFTPEQEARINDLLVEYLQQNGASIDAGVNVTELTGDALTDENLKKLTIPSILPNTNEWAYTSLENMMAPIQHAITHLQTEDAQVQTTINSAATATQTANTAAANADAKAAVADTAAAGAANVNATLEGSVIIVTDRAGVEHRTNLEIGIYATFTSVADMNAHAVSVPEGKLVVIATSDPTSQENARLYIRNSLAATAAEPFDFLCDLDQASAAAWADWLNNMKPQIEDVIETAGTDHNQAVSDHNQAVGDHSIAYTDHVQAGTDHTQAGTDHNTSVQQSNYAKSQGDYAKNMADHPAFIGDGITGEKDYWYTWNYSLQQYVKGSYAKGDNLDWDSMTPTEKEHFYEEVTETIAEEEGYAFRPVDVDTITPSSTFKKNSIIGINGVLYYAYQDTIYLPITLVTQGNAFVVNIVDGRKAFVVSDYTLNTGWKVWTDAAMDYWINQLSTSLNNHTSRTDIHVTLSDKSTWNGKQDFISDLDTIRTNAQKGASAIQMSDVITIEGTDYTVGQILSAIGEFMNKTIVVNG